MKPKDDMAKLRRGLILRFMLVLLAVVSVDNNIDLWWESYLQRTSEPAGWLIPILILIPLFSYLLGGYVFYLMVRKLLKKESDRRVQEQNLIYAAIAHDLKTPMTSVQGFAKALSEGRIKPEEQKEILDLICRKSGDMNNMVETLSDYAKLGIKNYKPILKDTDICVLVRNIAAENYNEFEDKDQNLEIDIPETPILVKADERELKRAFTNLILNASKHNSSSTNIKVAVSSEKGEAVITIADNGAALPPGMDIFEPFVTENTARTPGSGTGLGLAITKRIIERHQGQITAAAYGLEYTKAFIVKLPQIPETNHKIH